MHHGAYHCHVCKRSWSGEGEAHCPLCCRHFGGDRACERHKVYYDDAPTVCIPPDEVLSKKGERVLKLKESPYGPTWIIAQTGFKTRRGEQIPPAAAAS